MGYKRKLLIEVTYDPEFNPMSEISAAVGKAAQLVASLKVMPEVGVVKIEPQFAHEDWPSVTVRDEALEVPF